MATFSARASLSTNVQTCCQLKNHKGEFKLRTSCTQRRAAFCRSSSSGTNDVEVSPDVPVPQSPFSGGKISSKLAAKRIQTQQEAPVPQSPFAAGASISTKVPAESFQQGATAVNATTESKPAGPRLPPPPPTPNRAKAFQAPSVSSPFESDKSSIDDRILASRKSILKALWKEKQDSTRTPAPDDIFDEPKPMKTDESRFKLIYGTNQTLVLISFALIAGLMICTAILTWKLGAIHYNEL